MGTTTDCDWMTTTPASRVLGITADETRFLARMGILPSIELPRRGRIYRRADVERLAAEREARRQTSAEIGAA